MTYPSFPGFFDNKKMPYPRGKHQCKYCWRDFNVYRLTASGKKAEKRCPYCKKVLIRVDLSKVKR